MANQQHWTQIALNDPEIKSWYAQLRFENPNEPENVLLHMANSIQNYGGGSGKGFDYKTAIESGIKPELQPDGKYHWLGETPDKILKGPNHPTRSLTEQSRVEQTIQSNKGRVDQQLQLAETQKEVKTNLVELVQQYPEARNVIMSMVKDGVHDIGTIAKLAREEVQKKRPESVVPKTRWEKIKTSFSRGKQNIAMDLLWFEFMTGTGKLSYEELVKMTDEFEKQQAADPINADGWVEEILIPTANFAPSMWASILEGFKGATMGGGSAAVLGQLGPQAAIPEEIITVPAFAAAGAQANVAKFWYMQGAGSIYRDQVRKGVNEDIASVTASIGALPYAMIEAVSMKGLIPVSLKKEFVDIIAGGVATGLKKVGKEAGKEYTKQVGQEVAQEVTLIASEETATWLNNKIMDGSIPQAEGQEMLDRLQETFIESAKGLIIPVGLGGGVSAAGVVTEAQGKKKSEALVEEQVALDSMSPERAQLKKVEKEEKREAQPTAKLEVQAALEAGETSPGSASIANYLLEQDPDFDTRGALEISNEVFLMTDDYIRDVLGKDPEQFYEEEGITKEEYESGDYFATGLTQELDDFQKGTTRTAIKLFKGHDADTIVEEFYHDWWVHTKESDKKAFQKYHEESGDSRSVEEHFAQEGRDYFFSEKMHEKAGGLRAIFDNVKVQLKELIARIRKLRGAKIPKKIQNMYTRAGTRQLKPLTAAQKKKIKVDKAQFQLRQKPKSKEFKKWFGDSKIVDQKGNPKVVYHGSMTPGGIKAFDKNKTNIFWFAEDPKLANVFAGSPEMEVPGTSVEFSEKPKVNPIGANVTPAYVSVKNPIDFRKGSDQNRYWITKEEAAPGAIPMETAQLLMKAGKLKGTDLEKMIENKMVYETDPERLKEDLSYTPRMTDSFEPQDVIEMIENNNNVKLSYKIRRLLETMEQGEDIALYYYFEQSSKSKELIDLLQEEHGFDGIISFEEDLQSREKLYESVGVFNPEDIKGQFNPKPDKASPKIMHQVKKLNKRQKPKSKEFKSWFGDSKVVDDKGQPLVVYHGSVFDIESFNTPSYFTSDPRYAEGIADELVEEMYEEGDDWNPSQRIYPVYLNINKPKIIEEFDTSTIDVTDISNEDIKNLKSEGYDGIISGETYIAFEPNQIKGQFNPKPTKADPKIMFQVKKKTAALKLKEKPRSKEFQDWFKGSKVKENGKPMVMYHGTTKNIDRFLGMSYFTSSPDVANFYARDHRGYTDDPGTDKGAQVYPVYLDIKNPFDMSKDPEDAFKNLDLGTDFDLDDWLVTLNEFLRGHKKEKLTKEEDQQISDDFVREVTHSGNADYQMDGRGFTPKAYATINSFPLYRFIDNNMALMKALKARGFDGIVASEDTVEMATSKVYVAFDPEQIKSQFNVKPNKADSRIMFQVKKKPKQQPGGKPFEQWSPITDKEAKNSPRLEIFKHLQKKNAFLTNNPLDRGMVMVGSIGQLELQDQGKYPFRQRNEGKKTVKLSAIMAFDKGQGNGNKLLEMVKEAADETGTIIEGYAKQIGIEGPNTDELAKWYNRKGFNLYKFNDYFDIEYIPEQLKEKTIERSELTLKDFEKDSAFEDEIIYQNKENNIEITHRRDINEWSVFDLEEGFNVGDFTSKEEALEQANSYIEDKSFGKELDRNEQIEKGDLIPGKKPIKLSGKMKKVQFQVKKKLAGYHGTTAEFAKKIEKEGFDPLKIKEEGDGFWFKKDKRKGFAYSRNNEGKLGSGSMVEVKLDLNNPMTTQENFRIRRKLIQQIANKTPQEMTMRDWKKHSPEIDTKFKKEAARLGYDGVVGEEILVWDQSKIEVVKIHNKADSKIQFQVRKKDDLALPNIAIEKKMNLVTLATHLNNRALEIQKDLGVDLTKDTPEVLDILSDIIASEIKHELKDHKEALGWYTVAVDQSIKELSILYPKIKKGGKDNQMFKILMAITSNGAAPQDNLVLAMKAYDYYLANNVLPTKFPQGGQEAAAMAKGFKETMALIDKLGMEGATEFLNTTFTKKEMESQGFKIDGENIDTEVKGSFIYGPKIGAFLANLNGHEGFLTMDRWFMRSMGRLRGNLKPDRTKVIDGNIRSFRAALRVNKKAREEYNISTADLKDKDKMISVARKVLKIYAKRKYVAKDKKYRTYYPKTKLNMIANTLIKNIDYIQHTPRGGNERNFLRSVMSEAVKKSGVKGLSMADAQAIIWYPEKRFYAKFGATSQRGKKETNYAIEAKEYLQRRGDDKSASIGITKDDTRAPSKEGSKVNEKGKAKKAKEKVVFAVRPKRLIPKQKTPKQLAGPDSTFGIELDPENFTQLFERKIVDKMNRLGYVMEKFKEVRDISDEEDAYLAQELYIGKAKELMDRFEEDIFGRENSLLPRIIKAGYSMDDFGSYLHARHALERNEHVAKINEDLPDGGSGMTNDQAKQILKKYKGDKKIEALAKEFYRKVTKRALRMRLNSGLIDRKTYDYLNDYYKYYVPLFVVKEVENRTIVGQGLSTPQGSELKRVRGSEKVRGNPAFSAIYEMMGVMRRAEKNKVGQKFLNLAEEMQSSESWEIKKMRYMPKYNSSGEVEFMQPQFQMDDNVFAVRRDGDLYLITIKDEALASGLKNLGAEKTYKFLNMANAYIRSIVTTFNPEFIVTNFFRDIQTALVHLGGEYDGVAMTAAKNVTSAMGGVWKNVRGDKDTYWSQMYDELKKSGGKVGWFDMASLDEHQAKVEKQLKNVEDGKGGVIQAGKDFLELIEQANEAVESGIRLATYEALVKKGLSKSKAAQAAKNITVNFNKKGEWSSLFNSLWLFFNATVQGNIRIATSIVKSKKTRMIVGGMVANSMIWSLRNHHMNDEEWEKKNHWEKDNYLMWMNRDGTAYKVKVPYGYNIFHVAGQVIAEGINEAQKNGAKYVDYIGLSSRVIKAASDAISPFGDGSLLQAISPTVLDPIVQIAENKNFAGTPFMKPKYYDRSKPNFSNYYEKNPPSWVSRWTTESLSLISGGRRYKGLIQKKDGTVQDHTIPGVIDVNPDALDHLFGFLTGGTGKFFQRSFDIGMNFASGKSTQVSKIPFIRQFYSEPDLTGATEKRLIFKMKFKAKHTIYNHVEVSKFKKYVHDAIKFGALAEKDIKLVKDHNGKMIPKIINDFLKHQRLARGEAEPIKKKKRKVVL